MCPKQVCFVTFSGLIQVKISKVGERMTVVSHTRLAPIRFQNFCRNMIWTLFVELTRLWKMAMSFSANRQLVTIFSAPNYCGEFDNAGAMMSVDETLMCSFQKLKPAEKKSKFNFGSTATAKPGTSVKVNFLVFWNLYAAVCALCFKRWKCYVKKLIKKVVKNLFGTVFLSYSFFPVFSVWCFPCSQIWVFSI